MIGQYPMGIKISRSPHGERELKFSQMPYCKRNGKGRSPHGERELKSDGNELIPEGEYVAPHTGSVS